MAQFQLSITKTFVFDTDVEDQQTRDIFYVALKDVGWDEKQTPSTTQCEAALRKLIEADDNDDFWDHHIDLDEIGPQDVKIVNFSRQFDRFKKEPEKDTRLESEKRATQVEEKLNVKTPTSGKPEVASKPEAKDTASHPTKTSAHPAQRATGPGPAIQGARDSTQVKK